MFNRFRLWWQQMKFVYARETLIKTQRRAIKLYEQAHEWDARKIKELEAHILYLQDNLSARLDRLEPIVRDWKAEAKINPI